MKCVSLALDITLLIVDSSLWPIPSATRYSVVLLYSFLAQSSLSSSACLLCCVKMYAVSYGICLIVVFLFDWLLHCRQLLFCCILYLIHAIVGLRNNNYQQILHGVARRQEQLNQIPILQTRTTGTTNTSGDGTTTTRRQQELPILVGTEQHNLTTTRRPVGSFYITVNESFTWPRWFIIQWWEKWQWENICGSSCSWCYT